MSQNLNIQRKKNQSGIRIAFAILVSFTLLAVQCSSASSVDSVKPGTKFQIQCNGQQPIRYHYSPETGKRTESGPVQLAKDMSCRQAEGLDEKEMLKLQRQGEWTGFYTESQKPMWTGMFEKNKREGVAVYVNEDGKKTKIVTYKAGSKEGVEEGYFATGGIRYKGQNTDNMKTGLWEERGSESTDCVSKGNYSKDEKTGQWQECSQDEKSKNWYISFKGNYSQGLKDGPAEFFHSNGQQMATGSYRADLTCKENPPPEGVDMCGRRMGHWVVYYDTGKVAADGEYNGATGLRKGNWTEFYISGEKMATGPRNHTRDGIWTFYLKDGKIMGQYGFKGSDNMFNYCILYDAGVKKEEGDCMGGLIKYEAENDALRIGGRIMQNGVWKGYWPNGTKSYEGNFTTGIKMGKWKYFSETGGLASEGEYRMNKKVGAWKETQNGTLVTLEYDDFGREKK